MAKIFGSKIRLFDEIDSTNDEAKRLIASNPPEGEVIVAASQTKGRGRLGSRWVSPIGGIYMSVIIKPTKPAFDDSKITLIAASAVQKTLKDITSLDIQVKWPNDIMINGKKAAGILAEKIKGYIIVGIGINVNTNVADIPDASSQPTSLNAETGREFDLNKTIEHLLSEFENCYFRW